MYLRWMVPSITPAARAALLGGIQASAPASVLSAILDTVQPHLSQLDWAKLSCALAPASASNLDRGQIQI